MSDRQVSVSRVIDAPPEKIFDVLADPSRHPEIDGSGTVRAPRGQSQRLQLGSRFGMSMRQGLPYQIRNKVVEFEENRRIAWCHFFGHRWRYELEPGDGGTKVTETFDYSTARIPQALDLVNIPRKHVGNMERTLERLDQLLTGSA